MSDLAANDPAALDDIATYLNFDMVGSPNYIIGVYDANESTYPAPVEVPPGSAETEAVFTDYFDGIDQPWVDTEFSGRSDYQAFIDGSRRRACSPARTARRRPSFAMFGGTEGIFYDPNYHSPADTIDNVDATALDIMSRAIGHAVAALSEDTFAINGVGNPRIDAVEAEARCLNGTAYVAVRGANGERPARHAVRREEVQRPRAGQERVPVVQHACVVGRGGHRDGRGLPVARRRPGVPAVRRGVRRDRLRLTPPRAGPSSTGGRPRPVYAGSRGAPSGGATDGGHMAKEPF